MTRFGCPGRKPTAISVARPSTTARDLDPRQLLAVGDEPALVRRARRPAEAAEVHGLEQRRLAGAVRADDRRDAVAELDLEARVAAERGRPEALHAHARG